MKTKENKYNLHPPKKHTQEQQQQQTNKTMYTQTALVQNRNQPTLTLWAQRGYLVCPRLRVMLELSSQHVTLATDSHQLLIQIFPLHSVIQNKY